MGINSPNYLNDHSAEYNPEDFGFPSMSYVYEFRKALLRNNETENSDYLYEWDKGDLEGIENGGAHFQKFANSDRYFKRLTEVVNYEFEHNQTIHNFFKSVEIFIDGGPGLGKTNKTKVLIEAIIKKYHNEIKHRLKHIGVDISPYIIKKFIEEYKNNPNISADGSPKDRFQSDVFGDKKNSGIILNGGEIGNFKKSKAARLLARFQSQHYSKGTPIGIVFFLDPQGEDKDIRIEEILEIYRCKEDEDFIMKGLQSLGFDLNNLQFIVEYFPATDTESAMIRAGAQVKSTFSIPVGDNEYAEFKEGQKIRPISSRLLNNDGITNTMTEGNCLVKHIIKKNDIAICLAKTKKKEIPSYFTYGTMISLIIGSLIFGGVEWGKKIERDNKNNLKKLLLADRSLSADIPDLHTHNSRYNGNSERVEKESYANMQKIITLLQERYNMGIEFDDQQKSILESLYLDRIAHKSVEFSYPSILANQFYDPYLLGSHPLDKFVTENKFSLINLGLDIHPNHQFSEYKIPLQNSYFYKGEPVFFDKVEIEIPDYVGYITATFEDGTYEIQKYKAGIVYHNGIEYIVLKTGDRYALDERGDNIYQGESSSRRYIADIIGKGEAKVLSNQIKDFIIQKYGDKFTIRLNGQEEIYSYILDAYASGNDLSFLLDSKDFNIYSHKKDILDIFTTCFMIPDIKDKLLDSRSLLFGVRRNEVNAGIDKNNAIRETIEKTQDFASDYLRIMNMSVDSSKIRSLILKYMLLDKSRMFISNTGDMRCRLEDNYDNFQKKGIQIPLYPKDLRQYLVSHYDQNNRYQNIAVKNVDIQYAHMEGLNNFYLENGSKATFGIIHGTGWSFTKVYPVGKISTLEDFKQSEIDSKNGRVEQQDARFPRGNASHNIQTPQELFYFDEQKKPFNSLCIPLVIEDLSKREQSRILYEKRKNIHNY